MKSYSIRNIFSRILSKKYIIPAALSLIGCSNNGMQDTYVAKGNPEKAPLKEFSGCIQGVVVDGFTRARIALTDESAKNIYVVARDKVLTAVPLDSKIDGKKEDLKGEYLICGIPVGSKYPIYVKLTGFQEFYSDVLVPGVIEKRNLDENLEWNAMPVSAGDLVVFPKAGLAADYLISVTRNGISLVDAQVLLEPSMNINYAAAVGPVLVQNVTRAAILNAKTDAAGVAKIAAADLIFGGTYKVTIFTKSPADPGNVYNSNVVTISNLTIGKDSAASANVSSGSGTVVTTPFTATFNIGNTDPGVLEISKTDLTKVNPAGDGKIEIVFNRDIQLNTNAYPGAIISVGGVTTGSFKGDVTANSTGKLCTPVPFDTTTAPAPAVTYSASILSNKLTLTPVWKLNSAPDVTLCKNMKFTYTILAGAIQAKDSPEKSFIGGTYTVILALP